MKVIVSNKTENLLKHLKDTLQKDIAEQEIFTPVTIVVPNRNVEKYLNFTLAQEFPVILNFYFPFLEVALKNFIRNILYEKKHKIRPHLGYFFHYRDREKEIPFASKRFWQLLILEELLASPPKYFNDLFINKDSFKKEKLAYHLSRELAYLFFEYQYHRPNYIRHLQNNPQEIPPEVEDQLKLLFKVKEKLAKLEMEDIFSGFEKIKNELNQISLNEKIYFFALSQVSKFHYEFLLFLSQHTKIFIYQVLPDLNNFSLQNIDLGPLASIKNWELFCKLAKSKNIKYELIELYETNSPAPKIKFFEFSHKLAETPSPPQSKRQEVEFVAAHILELLKKKVPPQKIAVLVPDLDEYLGFIRAIFSQSLPEIPYNIADAHLSTVSQYAQGIFSLLNLLEGPFNRKNLFEIFVNPCFLLRYGLSAEDVENWVGFLDKLNVYVGAYPNEYYGVNEEKFSPPRDWQTVLNKARLELLLPKEGSLNPDESYLVFLAVVENLRRYYLKFKEIKNPKELIENFWVLMHEFLETNEEMPVENFAQKEIEKLFIELFEFFENEKMENFFLSLSLLKKILQNEINELPLFDKRQIASGVNIGKLNPMRPIPYSFVFLLGLNEGSFPKTENFSYLDLRKNFLAHQKEEFSELSDLSQTEKDIQLIYDTILCTREELYLSYCGYDLQKDVKKIPSEPYRKLKGYFQNPVEKAPSMDFLSENKIQAHEIEIKNSELKKSHSENFALKVYTIRDFKNFLQKPLFFYLSKEKLNSLDFGKSLQVLEKEFEDQNLESWQNLAIIEKVFYLCLKEKKDLNHDFLKILEIEIQERKKNSNFPFGFFSLEAETVLIGYGQGILSQFQHFSNMDFSNLKRYRLGHLDKRYDYLEVQSFLELPKNVLLAAVTPFYFCLDTKIITLNFARKSGDVPFSKLKNGELKINLGQFLSLVLPLYEKIQSFPTDPEIHHFSVFLEEKTPKVTQLILKKEKLKVALELILNEMEKKEIDTFLWDQELQNFTMQDAEIYEKLKENWEGNNHDDFKKNWLDNEMLIRGCLPFFLHENTLRKYAELYKTILEIAHFVKQ